MEASVSHLEPLSFRVAGGASEVLVRVKAYEHPECADYDDGNWLLADLTVHLSGFRASFGISARSPELEVFLRELDSMEKTLSGTASYEMIEPSLSLKAVIGKRGTIEWTGTAQYPLGSGNELSFEFESDQSYLPGLVESLRSILERFPIKGLAAEGSA
jgi:hypothetical protein